MNIGASKIFVGQKFSHESKHQGAILSSKEAGWMILEMANVNAEDRIGKCQRVKFNIRLSASFVYEAEFTVYGVKGFAIMPGK